MYLQSYLDQSAPLILYYPSPLHIDEQMNVFGIDRITLPLVQYFDTHDSTRGLIDQFVSSTTSMKGSFPRIVGSENWATLENDVDRPVLFFHVDWRLSYRRLPPDLKRYHLQAGVVSKIIPMSQVLSHRGTIALRTAAWDGYCLFDAMAGKYYTPAEWNDRAANRLEQSIREMQQSCGHKLAEQFRQHVGTLLQLAFQGGHSLLELLK